MFQSRQRRFLIAIFAIVLVAVPVPKLFIQQWTVRVVDENAAPIAGIRVSGMWKNYTFNLSGGSVLYTDSNGKVVFPPDRRFRPVLYWAAKPLWTLLGAGVHTSFGSRGRVWITDPDAAATSGATCFDTKCTEQELESELRTPNR